MKHLTNTFYAFALVFTLAACDQLGGGGTNVAYVNGDKIFRDSKVGKSLTKQINSYREKVTKKLEPEGKRLERERDRLQKQQSTLSKGAFETKARSFQEKAARFQQKNRQESERLQSGLREANAQINDVLTQIYEEVRKNQGIDVLLSGQVVLNGTAGVDVTDIVVEILNERMANVELEIPEK